MLTSYTKGRPLRTISKVPGQTGFEAYRLLVHRNMPKSQVRDFHPLQNIINFKSDSGRSLNENVLAFEQLIEDYEKISSVTVGSETKLAVIIANAPSDVQEHILLNYDDKKSYEDIRDYMLNVEENKRWTKLTTKEKRQTTTDLIESGQDHGRQADMDINQMKGNGKGKGKSFKGKGKGKGKSNWESGYGKGRGYKGRGLSEDVASKEEEKVVAMAVALAKVVESTTRKEVTGKVSAIIVKSVDTMKRHAG